MELKRVAITQDFHPIASFPSKEDALTSIYVSLATLQQLKCSSGEYGYYCLIASSVKNYVRIVCDQNLQDEQFYLPEDRQGAWERLTLFVLVQKNFGIAKSITISPIDRGFKQLAALVMKHYLLQKRIVHVGMVLKLDAQHSYRIESINGQIQEPDEPYLMQPTTFVEMETLRLEDKFEDTFTETEASNMLESLVYSSFVKNDNLGMVNLSNGWRCSAVLVEGPSGVGKSSLVNYVARKTRTRVILVDNVFSAPKWDQLILEKVKRQPEVNSLIIFDFLELLFPLKMDLQDELLKRFCSLMVLLQQAMNVLVVGITLKKELIHSKVRRWFTECVEVGNLSADDALTLISESFKSPQLRDQIGSCASIRSSLRSCAGRDIRLILQSMTAKQIERSLNGDPVGDRTIIDDAVFAIEGARKALATGEVVLTSDIPQVTWTDIVGQNDAKQALKEMVVWPHVNQQAFQRMGITAPVGLILHGPPGTGKTMLAKASANAAGCNFISVEAQHLIRSEFGESEKMVSRVFDEARRKSPCIIFLDEFQALFGSREASGQMGSSMVTQLLLEMDQLHETSETSGKTNSDERVTVVAATNVIEVIDSALLQSGRFENSIYVGYPSYEDRLSILNVMKARMPWDEDVEIESLAERSGDFSSAEMVSLCQHAGVIAIRESTKQVRNTHFKQALDHLLEERRSKT